MLKHLWLSALTNERDSVFYFLGPAYYLSLCNHAKVLDYLTSITSKIVRYFILLSLINNSIM